jgi:hypothetical protein
VNPPFSRRSGESKPWVQEDWPKSARTALLHLLYDLVDRRYVGGWVAIDKEVRRIARERPSNYNDDAAEATRDARQSTEAILANLKWDKMFDFCERLYSHLAISVGYWDGFAHQWEEETDCGTVQEYVSAGIQRIFLEENLAYTFAEGEVRRRGRNHTRELLAKAEPAMGDPRLDAAREHFRKALQYFDHPTKPDYENSVKEAVCCVEAAARCLFPQAKAKTLGDVVKRIQGSNLGQLPKPLADTLTGLYGYRSAGDGVSHGGADGGKVTPAIAEYVLGIAAAQVILLQEVAASSSETDVPF